MKHSIRTLLVVLRIVIGFGLLVYLGVSGVINWSALLGLAAFWQVSLLALGLLFVDVGLTSWRLCILLQPIGLHLSMSASIRLTLIGLFFNICLPGATGGDIVKIYYATANNHGRRTEVLTILLLDRAIGMFALLILPLLAAPFFHQTLRSMPFLLGLLWAAAMTAMLIIAAMALCSVPLVRHSQVVSWIFRHLPLGNFAARMCDTVSVYRHNVRILLKTVGLSLVVHTIMVIAVLLLVQATNASGAHGLMTILVPLGFLANSLPITPGGLGVGEAAFDKLFALAGLVGGAEALLSWRLLMTAIGLLGLVCYLQGDKRFISTHDKSALNASTPTVKA